MKASVPPAALALLRLIVVLLSLGYAQVATAVCDLAELGSAASCKAARKNLARLAECEEFSAGDLTTTRTRLRTVEARMCPLQTSVPRKTKCTDTPRAFDKLVAISPPDCLGKYQQEIALETMNQCPDKPKAFAERLRLVQRDVAICACKEDPGPRPGTCKEAETHRKRLALRTRCSAEDAVSAQAALKRAQRLEGEICSGLLDLFHEARAALDASNEEIAKAPECRRQAVDPSDACRKKRQIQLGRLALYLEFFVTTIITTDDDLAHARHLLTHVGAPPDAIISVAECTIDNRPCSPEEIRGASKLMEVLGSEARRAEFWQKVTDSKVRQNFKELVDLQLSSANPVAISRKLNSIPPEQRAALYSETSQLIVEETAQDPELWKKRNEKGLRRLEVVVGAPAGAQGCPLVQEVLSVATDGTGIGEPIRVAPGGYDTALDELSRRRQGHCTVATPTAETDEERRRSGTLGCGPVIGLLVEPQGENQLSVRAEVRWVTPGAVRQEPIPTGQIGLSREDQLREANRIISAIRMSYDRISNEPIAVREAEEGTLQRCGMTVSDVGPAILPAPRGLGVSLRPDWGTLDSERRASFEQGLVSRLSLKRRLIGPVTTKASVTLRVVATNLAGGSRVSLELRDTTRPFGLPFKSIAVVIDDSKKCADVATRETEGRWAAAGEAAADRLIDYYRSVELPVANDSVSRFLLPGAEWWRNDDRFKAAGGIAWSALDVSLLGSGVSLLGLSIKERNDVANGAGSLRRAAGLQYAGFGLLAGFVAERVIWALVGPEGSKK